MRTACRPLWNLRHLLAAVAIGGGAAGTPGITAGAPAQVAIPKVAIFGANDPGLQSIFAGSGMWLKYAEPQALALCKGRPASQAIAYLVANQRPDGSWSGEGLLDRGSFDDQCTAVALRALLEWYVETGDETVVAPAKKCIELLLKTQGKEIAPVGAWYEGGPFSLRVGGLWRMVPNTKEWPEDFWSHLNTEWNLGDDVTASHANALAMAYAVFGDKRCKEAVLACARSHAKLQELHKGGLPEHVGPRGEAMYGRPFEIPALSTRAVSYAIDVYVDAHRVSKDVKWLDAAKRSAAWLEPLKLSKKPLSFQGGKAQIMWPSLVEINTLRPVYGNKHGQAVYTLNEAYNPYGWWHPYPAAAMARAKAYFLKFNGSW